MGTSENSLIPENIDSVLAEAIKQAGEYTSGQGAEVKFSGALEGFDPRLNVQDGKRSFSVTFNAKTTEQFLREPSLELIFDQYGLPIDWLMTLEVDSITIEYVASPPDPPSGSKFAGIFK